MTSSYPHVTLFGGSGFVGQAIVRELARRDMIIRIASRSPQAAYEARTAGAVGQIVPLLYNPDDPASVDKAVAGSRYVINCTGILYEKGPSTFQAVHVDLVQRIAQACAANNVDRLIHLSALGIDGSPSRYAASKREGEKILRHHFAPATILRPSVIFGAEDNFFNLFAGIAQIAPVLPLIGGGMTRFQPVYVGDVADAVAACLSIPSGVPADPNGKTYQLAGPEIVTFRDIYAKIFEHTGLKRFLMPVPWPLATLKASVLQLFPVPLLTPDQVESLKADSIADPAAKGLKDLAVTPTAMDAILPLYLARYRPGGRFGNKKREAA